MKKKDYESEIEQIHPGGGAKILAAFKEAYNTMTMENYNKNKKEEW